MQDGEYDYNEGYKDGYKDGYNDGQGEVSTEEALLIVKRNEKRYSVFETKSLDDIMKIELLKNVYEKMNLAELQRVFSRHQRKLFGSTIIN